VKKIVPSTAETTIFVYDASAKLVAEYSTVVEPPSTAKVNYLTMDHLGSPRINTDANGNITARHDYMPFGEEIYTVQRTQSLGYTADTVRKQFTGYERDNESDLDFAEARYYNYNHGRFSSPDNFLNDTHKEDPASWNLYVYVRNNPLTYVDPTGEELRLIRITDKDGNVVENIDGENRKALLGWLNHTYGCSSCVTVDKNNVIQLDTSQVSKEVLAATKDLTDAINDKNHIAFVVGYDGHSKVNFAQAQQNALEVGGKKYDAILVDFKDFRGLSGDKAAVSSFTNYAFVHEVFHLFPSLLKDDISSEDVTGPVENKVNEIRQARGDLLRATYNARSDTEIWGEMDFGTAKVNKKTGQIMRNVNNGILVEKKKIVRWNIRMTGN